MDCHFNDLKEIPASLRVFVRQEFGIGIINFRKFVDMWLFFGQNSRELQFSWTSLMKCKNCNSHILDRKYQFSHI